MPDMVGTMHYLSAKSQFLPHLIVYTQKPLHRVELIYLTVRGLGEFTGPMIEKFVLYLPFDIKGQTDTIYIRYYI